MQCLRVLGVLFLLFAITISSALSQRRTPSTTVGDRVDHESFTRLLTRFVDGDGNVDYAALAPAADTLLTPYLEQLAAADPARWDRDARLAFWINAYNAYTLKLIVDHYPIENIWAVTPGPAEPKEDSPFEQAVGPVADTVRTLDEIEHEIIRVRFDEPRIHFALVCAAKSCPQLRRGAYVGPRLDAQLEAQTKQFLHDNRKNRIPAAEGRVALSPIFKWYGEDFGSAPSDLQHVLAPYFEGEVRAGLKEGRYEIEYLPYDWSLNAQGSSSPSVEDPE